jgi:opacity protein-like surface antigen
MRKLLVAAALAASAMAAVPAAQAFTVAAPAAPADENVVRVAGGCGLGWHRGPWGGCRANGYGYYRPYAYVAPGPAPGCWWRATPYGPRRVCAW